MIYLLDANILIQSKRQYYQFGRVDEYWDWLKFQFGEGHAKVPAEICEEILVGKDKLVSWVKGCRPEILLDESVNAQLVNRVIKDGYDIPLDDTNFPKLGRDPVLIAYALAHPEARIVVTNETKGRKDGRRKIPDVCERPGVKCCNRWTFGWAQDFRTWPGAGLSHDMEGFMTHSLAPAPSSLHGSIRCQCAVRPVRGLGLSGSHRPAPRRHGARQ